MAGTVIYDDREPHALDEGAREDGDRLWISVADLEPATGWTRKPEGLCRDEACVPLPADGTWLDDAGRLDLTAFARAEARPALRDEQHGIWAFGPSLAVAPDGVEAPDFTLPDIDGQLHSLSDYRASFSSTSRWLSASGIGAVGERIPHPTTNPTYLRDTTQLALLAEGLRNAEIADRLVLSPRTVDHHVSSVLGKLDARTRAEAAATAIRLGLTEAR
jgi:DNA-binding CsgD family transcriptional regulator